VKFSSLLLEGSGAQGRMNLSCSQLEFKPSTSTSCWRMDCIVMYLISELAEGCWCRFSNFNAFHSESTWTFCGSYIEHFVSVGICCKFYYR
jgi:hypothetical protein